MPNHYHLVVETPDGNLAKGMRQFNGVYTQKVNRRHGRSGHVFQGRYTAILVDADAHLLELARHVVLNPVRAGMVDGPKAWRWSSYLATTGKAKPPPWLAADALLAHFASERTVAVRRYRRFVAEGVGAESIWTNTNGR